MSSDLETGSDLLEIFWMPGCSSCLRMKEFVNKHGIPHKATNVAADPASRERLTQMGFNVPAAVLGGKAVPGVDLVGIAKLVGYDYEPPQMLAPVELKAKYDDVWSVAVSLIGQLPAHGLEYKSPDRDRSLRELSLHIATIMRGFVAVEDTNVFTAGYEFITDDLISFATTEGIVEIATDTKNQFDQWWNQVGFDDAFDRVVESVPDTGHWNLHEALERAVWHTSQHTRQLEYFAGERLGVEPAKRLTEDMLAGLPLPEGIHAGAEG